MTDEPQPPAITPAQRVQVLREELAWFEHEWEQGAFDNLRDVWVEMTMRIEYFAREAAGGPA